MKISFGEAFPSYQLQSRHFAHDRAKCGVPLRDLISLTLTEARFGPARLPAGRPGLCVRQARVTDSVKPRGPTERCPGRGDGRRSCWRRLRRRLKAMAKTAEVRFERLRPTAKDWNDEVKGRGPWGRTAPGYALNRAPPQPTLPDTRQLGRRRPRARLRPDLSLGRAFALGAAAFGRVA